MTKQTILYLLLLLLVAIPGAAVNEYEGYTNPAGNKFPIAIYDNVPLNKDNVQILTEAEQKAYFDTISLAGFNVEIWDKGKIYTRDAISKWGPYLKNLGMNTIISSRGYSLTRSATPYNASTPDSILLEDNWNGLKTVIGNFSKDPNVWGYLVADEPKRSRMQKPVYELNKNEAAIIPTFNMVHKYKGSKVAYANLGVAFDNYWIGDFASEDPERIYVEQYENFLDYVVDVLGLELLTFDIYPVIHHESKYGPGWNIKPFYYNIMDLYGRYCRDKNIPVWLVMLGVEHLCNYADGSLYWEYPEITYGFLSLQAMNGLAFGMKGLAYWQYGAQNTISGDMLYKSALYDMNKKTKTAAWDAAKQVNDIVAKYGAILQNATYDDSCIAENNPENHYDGFQRFSKSFHGITSFEHTGGAVLISHLTKGDTEYIAVVNQDHLKSQKIMLWYDANHQYKRVWLTATMALNDYGIAKCDTFTLGPGGMMLYVRNIKK